MQSSIANCRLSLSAAITPVPFSLPVQPISYMTSLSRPPNFMNTLRQLLIILGQQKLLPGYLTPAPSGTALDTVISLMQQFSYYTLLQNPLPNMTNQVGAPNVLLCPAWVASLKGQDAIFLADVEGRMDVSHTPQPAFIFANPTA